MTTPTEGIVQRRDDLGEIIARDANVAVGEDEQVVTAAREDVDEVADLVIRAVQPRFDHELEVERGELLLQAPHRGYRRIVRVPDAADDLIMRIVLQAEGTQVFVGAGLGAVERLQNARGRLIRGALQSLGAA